MHIRHAAFALAALLAIPTFADIPPPRPMPPAGTALCTFKTIHAMPGGDGSMDPAITMLREDLKKPPFTAWRTFRMLDKKEHELTEGAAANFSTPDGRSVVLTYAGHVIRKGKHAIKLVLDFQGGADKSDTKTAFTLDEGGHFVVAGHRYEGGILIYAVSCKTEQ